MRLGFFGNTNNYPFMLARAMRRQGHDVLFVVDSREKLHRPENRYADIGRSYPAWIRDESPFSHLDWVLPTRRRRRVVDLLRQCDAVVLNGIGPSLLGVVRRPALALLSGSDLLQLANPATIAQLDSLPTRWGARGPAAWRWARGLLYTRLIRRQRAGISAASVVSFFARGIVPQGDLLLDELGVADERRWFAYMTDLELVPPAPAPESHSIRIFCATRLTWKQPPAPGTSQLDYKGSDTMIRGLGMFWRRCQIPIEVRLVRKGLDVEATRALVDSEGIGHLVTWLDEMSQQGVLEEFRQADIVFEQLATSVIGMAGLDAMATGRPLIANGRPEIFDTGESELAPICQAARADEVCAHLESLASSRELRARVGAASRRYVERWRSSDYAAQVLLARLARVRS